MQIRNHNQRTWPVKKQSFNFLLTAVLMFSLLAGCATEPEKKRELPPEEQVKLDNQTGMSFVSDFEKRFKFKKADPKVISFLQEVAKKEFATLPGFKNTPIEIKLISDENAAWYSYGLSGVRLYLSLGLLKEADYESVLAALVALQVSSVYQRVALKRLQVSAQASLQSSAIDMLDLIEPAVQILYDAEYDSRGLISLWDAYLSNPKNSPYSEKEIQSFKDKTRRAIANNNPLINPIVRTEKFIAIMDRIKKL